MENANKKVQYDLMTYITLPVSVRVDAETPEIAYDTYVEAIESYIENINLLIDMKDGSKLEPKILGHSEGEILVSEEYDAMEVESEAFKALNTLKNSDWAATQTLLKEN